MAAATRRRSGGTERDYIRIAQERVYRPQQVEDFWKILAYSRNKKGKTTFSLSAGVENTLLIDPEFGPDKMKRQNPYVFPVRRWEDMQDAWGAVRTMKLCPAMFGGESKVPFTWIAVDGTTKLNNMALRYIGQVQEERDLDRRPGIIDRRDYNKSGELMKDMINNFLNLRMNVVFTAQERMMAMDVGDSDEDDETTFFVPDLPNGVRGALNSVVDVIGRLYVVRVDVKGEEKLQRRMQIGVHERYDTGFRSDYGEELPSMIRYPTIPKLTRLLATGSVKTRK
jgi:AAA domain